MFEKLFKSLSRFVVQHSKLIIIFGVVFTLGIGFFIKNLYIDNDMMHWVSPSSKIGRLPHYIDKKFGGIGGMLIVIKADDIFTYPHLTAIRNISDLIKKVKGVGEINSLTEIKDMKKGNDSIVIDDLIGKTIPKSPMALKRLEKYVLSKDLYKNKLISADGTQAMISIEIKSGEKSDVVAAQVKKTVEKYAEGKDFQVYYSGLPVIMGAVTESVVKDLAYLVPLVVVIVLLVLFLTFRTIRGVVLPLLAVIMATAVSLGLMYICGADFSVMGAAIPVILIAVGSAYGIHVMNKYYEETTVFQANATTAVRHLIVETGLPVLMAGLTTFFGFLSLITSDLSIMRSFAIFIALGVVLAIFFAIIFIPAVLNKMKVQKAGIYREENEKPHVFSEWVAKAIIKYRWPIILFFSAVIILSATQFSKIDANMDMLSYFKKDSSTVKTSKMINKTFHGINPFSIYIKGDIESPDVQKLMMIIEGYTKSVKKIGTIGGVQDFIAELNYLMGGLKTIPETKSEIQNLWFFIEGRDELKKMVGDDKKEALINFMLPSVATEFNKVFMNPLEKFILPYQKGVKSVAVSSANSRIQSIVERNLQNLISYDYLNISNKVIAPLVKQIAKEINTAQYQISMDAIEGYLMSDDCEVEISRPALAHRIAIAIVSQRLIEKNQILDYLKKVLIVKPDYEEDRSMLAETLSMQIKESFKAQKIKKAILLARKFFKDNVTDSELNQALSPLLWKTMPVPESDPGFSLAKVPVTTIKLTGRARLTIQLQERLIANQIMSLVFALIAVIILNSFLLKSVKKGLLSLFPILITLAVNFGIMGLFHISLDFVSMAVASIAVGVGIDYTIHFSNRFTREINSGNDIKQSIAKTLNTTGKAVLSNALSVGLGFAVLMFSDFAPLNTMGELLAISMLTSSLTALILFPAILYVFERKDLLIILKDKNSGGTK